MKRERLYLIYPIFIKHKNQFNFSNLLSREWNNKKNVTTILINNNFLNTQQLLESHKWINFYVIRR